MQLHAGIFLVFPAGMNYKQPPSDMGFRLVIGTSKALRESIDLAQKVAQSGIRTVLLAGETGTGKELFARGIHYASATAGEPFVAVNCAAIPAALLESELFGYERGAFTDAHAQKRGLFELAGAGTLLLDEVTDLPANMQAKLLRVLEERRVRRVGGTVEVEIRCRVISASQRSLDEAVASGAFREDLMYRLSAFRITLPSLRERDGDLPILARHFLEQAAREHGAAAKRLTTDAEYLLRRHSWPGNIRELRNVIERAALLSEGATIGPEHILISRRAPAPLVETVSAVGEIRIPRTGITLDEIECEAIRLTLKLTRGNQSEAARVLAISRPTLLRKMRKYALGTERKPWRAAVLTA
jgi:two-component system response regulator AtoC